MGPLRSSLGYVRCLRAFLALGDFEFYRVAFLQALVSLRGDRAVVNKYVRSIRAPNEPVPFCVIEPLYGSFQPFHVTPRFPHVLYWGAQGRARVKYRQ